MRMTRAALRAQEAEDELKSKIDNKLGEQDRSTSSNNVDNDHNNHNSTIVTSMIHEDSDKENRGSDDSDMRKSSENDDDVFGRPALRDITTENYPGAPQDEQEPGVGQVHEGLEVELKSQKKAKSKKGKKGGKVKEVKTVAEHVVESQSEIENVHHAVEGEEVTDPPTETVAPSLVNESQEQFSPGFEQEPPHEACGTHSQLHIQHEEQSSSNTSPPLTTIHVEMSSQDESEALSRPEPETPSKLGEIVSKTPRFDPEVHLPVLDRQSVSFEASEDSFVDSIRTRSPSKLSQSLMERAGQEERSPSTTNGMSQTPSKTSSQSSSITPQRIEDSVEAMDALEDAIEKFSEDLPVLQNLPFESPVRTRKNPSRTPAKPVATSPSKTLTSKTPSKSTPIKTRTPSIDQRIDAKTPLTSREKMASVVKERVKAIESRPSPTLHRRATSIHLAKRDSSDSKTAMKSKHVAAKSVSSIPPANSSSLTFSKSPVKQSANVPKKRVTSGASLVTSKPGFVPAKSSKPTTKSSFTLPGEAVAAKLKAQREERMKRDEETEAEKKTTFKARPAPVKTARPSVMPRENKTSTARLQGRHVSSENKENVAPGGPAFTIAPAKLKPSARTTTNTTTTANSSARRTTIAPKSNSTISSAKHTPNTDASITTTKKSAWITSLASGQPSTVTKTEAAQQRLKGKEVYGRIKGSVQQQEEEKKAKEEAARKARAEAAEKGRQASREWAEKQKARSLNVKGVRSR